MKSRRRRESSHFASACTSCMCLLLLLLLLGGSINTLLIKRLIALVFTAHWLICSNGPESKCSHHQPAVTYSTPLTFSCQTHFIHRHVISFFFLLLLNPPSVWWMPPPPLLDSRSRSPCCLFFSGLFHQLFSPFSSLSPLFVLACNDVSPCFLLLAACLHGLLQENQRRSPAKTVGTL